MEQTKDWPAAMQEFAIYFTTGSAGALSATTKAPATGKLLHTWFTCCCKGKPKPIEKNVAFAQFAQEQVELLGKLIERRCNPDLQQLWNIKETDDSSQAADSTG